MKLAQTGITPSQFLQVTKAFIDDIKLLKAEGGDVVFNPDAEKYLVKLLQVEEVVNEALDYVKNQIGESGKRVHPGFKGFKGGVVDGVYRKYGEKYWYDKSRLDEAMPYLKEITYFKVDSSKVDEYLETVGEMPEGVNEKDRRPQLSLKFKDDRKLLHEEA